MTRLHAEISRSINFYRSQQGGSAPGSLFLTGGTVRLPQLDQFFMESLQAPVEFINPFVGVGVGSRVNMSALENDAFTLAESVGLALRQTDLASIKINLMPPEIIEQARAIRRIPFLVVGALAVWGALGAAWYAETHLKEIAEEQYEIVKQDRTRLEGESKKLEKAQKDVAQECAKCDEFQQLLRERTLAIRRLNAARDSLKRIDEGLWITKWEPYEQKDEKELSPPKVGAYITFRGWRDVVEKAEAAWSAKNAGKTSTVNEIVVEFLKGLPDLFDKDEVKVDDKDGYKELGDCLREYKIKVGFAAAPSISQKAAGGKRKAAQK
jgi:type IV pilus assembly protein PilM